MQFISLDTKVIISTKVKSTNPMGFCVFVIIVNHKIPQTHSIQDLNKSFYTPSGVTVQLFMSICIITRCGTFRSQTSTLFTILSINTLFSDYLLFNFHLKIRIYIYI